jgi:lipopolysaccharide/colanic/teichoic acid biosynthesis glycosyltransferase
MESTVTCASYVKQGLPRVVELAIAIPAALVAAPIILLAALAVAISSKGPVFFRQDRVGSGGRLFSLIKLRTMRVSNAGPQVTSADDDRVTPAGKILRATKIDELPQLWNVIRGDMALVGPRPEVPRYVVADRGLWPTVLQAKPGIADPVTVRLRNEEDLLAGLNGSRERFYIDVLQPYKLKGYADYLRTRNWASDVGVLVDTAMAVVAPNLFPPPTMDEIVKSNESGASSQTAAPSRRHSRLPSWLQPSRLMIRQTQWAVDILTLSAAFLLA